VQILGIHHVAFAHPAWEAAHEILSNLLDIDVAETEQTDGFVERMIDKRSNYPVAIFFQRDDTRDRAWVAIISRRTPDGWWTSISTVGSIA
jgi:hypothetical protein